MALMCVRQSMLEDLHRGLSPVTKAGDYSDVVVIDAEGRHLPWPDVSRFDEDEMRDLMRQIVNKIYTFLVKMNDPDFTACPTCSSAIADEQVGQAQDRQDPDALRRGICPCPPEAGMMAAVRRPATATDAQQPANHAKSAMLSASRLGGGTTMVAALDQGPARQ